MQIEIDAPSGLFLASTDSRQPQRFAGIFRRVWLSIGMEFRAAMVEWWKQGFAGQPGPQINLAKLCDLPGKTEGAGLLLNFNSCAVDMMPDDFVASLIAHELAHVWHYSIPTSFAQTQPNNRDAKEDEADNLAISWGYDMQRMRDWANQHIDDMIECGVNIEPGQRW